MRRQPGPRDQERRTVDLEILRLQGKQTAFQRQGQGPAFGAYGQDRLYEGAQGKVTITPQQT